MTRALLASFRRASSSLAVVVAMLVALLWPSPARAQEPVVSAPQDAPFLLAPHQNVVPKVPPTFEVRTEGTWLTIAYPREYHDRVEGLLQDLRDTRTRVANALGRPEIQRIEVRIARDPEEMARVAPEGAPPFSYASGMAYGPLRLITVSLVAPQGAQPVHLEETLRHELVHAAIYEGFGQGTVPRWFNEGLAIGLSGELALERVETLRGASLSGTLFPFSEIDRRFFGSPHDVQLAYAQSADFVRFLSKKEDHQRFVRMLDRVASGQPFDSAMTDAYGADLRKLEFQWKSDLAQRMPIWSIVGSFVSFAMVGLFGIAWWKRRKKSKETLARWEQEEAEMDEVLRRIEAATQEHEAVRVPPQKLPKVEHGGAWHTLH